MKPVYAERDEQSAESIASPRRQTPSAPSPPEERAGDAPRARFLPGIERGVLDRHVRPEEGDEHGPRPVSPAAGLEEWPELVDEHQAARTRSRTASPRTARSAPTEMKIREELELENAPNLSRKPASAISGAQSFRPSPAG